MKCRKTSNAKHQVRVGRYPITSVLLFAAIGLGLGLGLSYWEPDDPNTKAVVIQWVGLIGDLFIRALKCIVLPLVFVNVILSVVDMMSMGRASSVGGLTIGLYTLTTLIASILGLISIICFQPLFDQGDFDTHTPTGKVQLACNEGEYLTQMTDGSVECIKVPSDNNATFFYLNDVDGTFVHTSSGPADDISMSDTLYDGLFMKLVTDNIFVSNKRAMSCI